MAIVKLLNCNIRIYYYLFFKCNYNKYFLIFFIYIKYYINLSYYEFYKKTYEINFEDLSKK